MYSNKELIDEIVEKNKCEIITFLQEMIRINTENPPIKSDEFIKYFDAKLKSYDFETEVIGKEARPNIIAKVKGNNEGKTLILNPHFDVVPAGEGWSVQPYGGEIIDGKIYGRGSYDCKGRIAVFASAMRLLKELKLPFNGEIVLVTTCDEETGGTEGAKYLLEEGLLEGDMCIGEGSDEMLYTAHKGILHTRITTYGKASHGGRCWMGVNAIEKANKILNLLIDMKHKYEELGSEYYGKFNKYTSINIGKIEGGVKVNSVPDFCSIEIDCRVAPEFSTENLLNEIKSNLEEIKSNDSEFSYDIKILLMEEPDILDSNCNLFKTVRKAYRDWTGKELPMEATYSLTDARYFRRAGIPAINFCGPGGPGQGIGGHCADEHIKIEHLMSSVKMMIDIIQRLLS